MQKQPTLFGNEMSCTIWHIIKCKGTFPKAPGILGLPETPNYLLPGMLFRECVHLRANTRF